MAQEETKSNVTDAGPTGKVRHPQVGCLERQTFPSASKDRFSTETKERKKASFQHILPNLFQKFFIRCFSRPAFFETTVLKKTGVLRDPGFFQAGFFETGTTNCERLARGSTYGRSKPRHSCQQPHVDGRTQMMNRKRGREEEKKEKKKKEKRKRGKKEKRKKRVKNKEEKKKEQKREKRRKKGRGEKNGKRKKGEHRKKNGKKEKRKKGKKRKKEKGKKGKKGKRKKCKKGRKEKKKGKKKKKEKRKKKKEKRKKKKEK